MSKTKFSDLLDEETIEFFDENLSMRESIDSQIEDDIYELTSKEGIADTNEEDIKAVGEIHKSWLTMEFYKSIEEAENAFNAVKKTIYTRNALNIGKNIDPDNLVSVTVDNTGTISIGTV